MGRPKYILESPDVPNPLKDKGGKGDHALVYSDEDLKRRTDAAKAAGIKVNVKRYPG
jgi:hypothetical protein